MSFEKLVYLKHDLQMTTTANDAYLNILLNKAEAMVKAEGITAPTDVDEIKYNMAIVDYAAYLFRKRASADTTMPFFLRRELNNLKIQQEADGGDTNAG